MNFSELGVRDATLKATEKLGYRQPTFVQQKSIPDILAGRDLIGCAKTGSGKTAAFALPTLQRLHGGGKPKPTPVRQRSHENRTTVPIRALVLSPTRELAAQICKSFQQYGQFTDLKTGVIFGGVSQVPQVKMLAAGVDILVATPGRLLDLKGQGEVDLRRVKVLVIDEADQMLDMGFLPDLKLIVAATPRERQTLMFSATILPQIKELASRWLKDPKSVGTERGVTLVKKIKQSVYHATQNQKTELLIHFLKRRIGKKSLVFARTKNGADRITAQLNEAGIRAVTIHSDKSQTTRQRTLAQFQSKNPPVLVATDIAARGLDIERVSFVINFDVPDQAESYIHRIGRTGRAGRLGTAITFCAKSERNRFKRVEELTKIKMERKELPSALLKKWAEMGTPVPTKEEKAERKKKVDWRAIKANKVKKKFYGSRASVGAKGEKLPTVQQKKKRPVKKKKATKHSDKLSHKTDSKLATNTKPKTGSDNKSFEKKSAKKKSATKKSAKKRPTKSKQPSVKGKAQGKKSTPAKKPKKSGAGGTIKQLRASKRSQN